MQILIGCLIGFCAWFLVRYLIAGFYTVDQNERAVKTSFGRAERVENASILDDPIAEHLRPEEKERYRYPQVRVIPPGGPYWKWPWEKVHKVSVATQTLNMAFDPENPRQQWRHDSRSGALQPITEGPEMASAMFEILEAQKIIEGEARISMLPKGSGLLADLLAAAPVKEKTGTVAGN